MRRGLTLLIDADDTLWENNVHFEDVIRRFGDLMETRGVPRGVARETLNEIERRRTKVNGYGVANFFGSLCEACEILLAPGQSRHEVTVLAGSCDELVRRPVTVISGVEPTLRELAGRHRLILFTKGDYHDQTDKLLRSGLKRYLHQVDVVREKDVEAYREVMARRAIPSESAWMIGNSPKSDIRPALAAGLSAVFISHAATWELEQEELPREPEGRLLVLGAFADLTRYF